MMREFGGYRALRSAPKGKVEEQVIVWRAELQAIADLRGRE